MLSRLVGLGLLTLIPSIANAQSGEVFRAPFADPMTPRFSIGLAQSNLVAEALRLRVPNRLDASNSGNEEALGTVAMGTRFEFLGSNTSDLKWSFGMETAVFALFRMDVRTNDYYTSDWMFSFPLAVRSGPVSAQVRFLHHSAHLGDETMHWAGVQPIQFTKERLDALVSVEPMGRIRFYAGGQMGARRKHFGKVNSIQTGTEITLPLGSERIQAIGAVDVRTHLRAEASERYRTVSKAGIRLDHKGNQFDLVLHRIQGPTEVGQMRGAIEKTWGVSLSVQP